MNLFGRSDGEEFGYLAFIVGVIIAVVVIVYIMVLIATACAAIAAAVGSVWGGGTAIWNYSKSMKENLWDSNQVAV